MRERGFTLIELFITVTLITIVSGTMLTVGRTIHERDRLSSAYAQDLSGLRRAARTLQDDLRQLDPGDALPWRLDGTALLRAEEVVARNIQTFDVDREGALARVHLALAPRTSAPGRREAVIAFAVRLRSPEAPR